MPQGEQNILSVLNLLTMLYGSRKTQYPKLSEDEQSILVVTKEHVALTGLTVPTFINTLNSIGRKGYLFGISIYEKKYHKLFKDLQKPNVYGEIMKQLEGSKKNVISRDDKRKFFEPLVKALVPQKHVRDTEEIIEENITISELFADSLKIFEGHTEENVSYVLLSPYRDLNRLLTKLNDGETLKSIQDQEIWFNPLNNTLYYFSGSIYLGNIKRAKEALLALFSQNYPEMIYFDDIPESSGDSFNKKEQKAYYDSLLRVLGKDLKLKDIFILHHDHFEIKLEHRDHAH